MRPPAASSARSLPADDGGWLQDPVLLDRLVGREAEGRGREIAAEGWKWIEVAVSFPYGHDHGLRELVGTTVDLTDEERATREALARRI
jgi:ParB family chromosome partitioning protein